MKASTHHNLPYLLGGYAKRPGNDRPAYVPPFGVGLCALTTGRRIDGRVVLDTGNLPKAH